MTQTKEENGSNRMKSKRSTNRTVNGKQNENYTSNTNTKKKEEMSNRK